MVKSRANASFCTVIKRRGGERKAIAPMAVCCSSVPKADGKEACTAGILVGQRRWFGDETADVQFLPIITTTKGKPMRLLPAAAVVLALAASPLVLVQTTSSQSTTPAPGGSAQPQWYSHQAGEMRASKLIGTRVNNEAGERIGEVNEIVLSKDGKVAAVVIGVGGFLGMGEHEVAVKFESLRLTQDANNNTIVAMSATKDSLKAAPEWRWSGEGGSGTTGKGTPPADKPTK